MGEGVGDGWGGEKLLHMNHGLFIKEDPKLGYDLLLLPSSHQ